MSKEEKRCLDKIEKKVILENLQKAKNNAPNKKTCDDIKRCIVDTEKTDECL